MKTIKFYSVLVLISFLLSNFTLLAVAQETNLYRSSMEKTLTRLDSAKTVNDLLQCRNQFERIAMKFTDCWQPVYYTAYCDIQMVYVDNNASENKARLEDAKNQLGKLAGSDDMDKSEINTLWGYFYNAQLLFYPSSAQTLFSEVIASYEKAIAQNPENPRPVVLRVFFNQFLPDFVQLKLDAPQEVDKARKLFEKEEKSIDSPYWGRFFLDKVKIN